MADHMSSHGGLDHFVFDLSLAFRHRTCLARVGPVAVPLLVRDLWRIVDKLEEARIPDVLAADIHYYYMTLTDTVKAALLCLVRAALHSS